MRKTSGKTAAREFLETLDRLDQYVDEIEASGLRDQAKTWAYEAALIKTHVAFETVMLRCLVASINNDTSTISARTSLQFPKHLTDEVCEYLITRNGYFDFKGREGLKRLIKYYVPDDHWLLRTIKDGSSAETLDRLVALRNFAAHESPQSKRRALQAVGQQRMGSAGAWIKCRGRFKALTGGLRHLGRALGKAAPY